MPMNAMRFLLKMQASFTTCDILVVCDCFKMLGIHARMIATDVVKFKAIRDWAYNQCVGDTVRQLAIFCTDCKSAVALHLRSCPDPAPIRASEINFGPEAFDRGIIEEHRKLLLYDVMRRAVHAVPSPLIISQGKLS